jgi:hypothetical protein
MTRALKIAAAALLAGCATQPSYYSVPTAAAPTCQGKEDCELRWTRAVQWINANSRLSIRMMNDTVIETHAGFGDASALTGFRVTRVPLGDGKYQLQIDAACANVFICVPPPNDAALRLMTYINSGY